MDTLLSLVPAFEQCRSIGFVEIEPYYDNPASEQVVYLELDLVNGES